MKTNVLHIKKIVFTVFSLLLLQLMCAQLLCAHTLPIDTTFNNTSDSIQQSPKHTHLPADSLAATSDSLKIKQDSLQLFSDSLRPLTRPHRAQKDSLSRRYFSTDSIDSSTYQPPERKSNMVDAPIEYTAKDSIVLTGTGIAFLHGEGDLKYKDMTLTSEYIRVKMDSSTIYAKGVYDTINNEWVGRPVFEQGEDNYQTNEITYNLKTQKGYIRHVVTQQGEGYIISERTKKIDNENLMMADGKYTTCDDHEHPHFYLAMTKAKVRPKHYIATGPAYMVVGDVPLPLAIPFGFFPFTDKNSSGIIMPQFGDDYTRGLYLRNGGYYFAINDYVDLQIVGDLYTKGTWAIKASSKYVWRYHFNGNISFDYRKDVTGEKGMPDYTAATNMSIKWTHTQDQKANPYNNFSASVNFSTSGYNRSNIDSYYNAAANSENTKSSSINYTQRFPDSPWSISMSALVSQRTKDSTISLTLPDINVSMSRVYPFKRKNPIGKEKWYEKISISYTGNIKNSIDCKENYLFHSNFLNDWRNGVKHSIPVSASFTLFKYLTLTPTINYNERWYFQRIDQQWDKEQNTVVRDTTNGFYRVWDLSTGVSLSTKIYGFYTPIRKLFGDKVDRFRHVLTPSISFNYTPEFSKLQKKMNTNYYGEYLKPTVDSQTGDTTWNPVTYSRYQNGMFGTPSQIANGSISFSLGNNLEMKIRNDKDTTGKNPYKVISLIDNFSITGAYNFLADSMKWSNFTANLRIKLPLNYTLNLSGQFDPYMYELNADGNPVRTNKQYWHHKKFLNFLGTSTSISYTFNNQTFKKWFDKKNGKKTSDTPPPTESESPSDESVELDPSAKAKKEREAKKEEVEAGYVKTDFQWSLSINYTVRYAEDRSSFNYDKMKYNMQWTHNLSLSGSLSLGKGWKVSATTSYDFKAKQFTYTNFNVSRDLHCWSMSCSFVPFGPYKSYTFHIGVNAAMLADLKYDKSSTSSTNANVNWW